MSPAPGAPERPDPQDDPAASAPEPERALIPRRPDEPGWMRLIGPIRSEGAAFRAVAWVAGGAVAIAVVVLLVRAVG